MGGAITTPKPHRWAEADPLANKIANKVMPMIKNFFILTHLP
jgi:hypothetical protein